MLPVCLSDQTANIARHFSSFTVNMILISTSGNLTKHCIMLGYLLHFGYLLRFGYLLHFGQPSEYVFHAAHAAVPMTPD